MFDTAWAQESQLHGHSRHFRDALTEAEVSDGGQEIGCIDLQSNHTLSESDDSPVPAQLFLIVVVNSKTSSN